MFWGLISQVQVLKVRGARCGVQTLCLSRRSLGLWVLCYLWAPLRECGLWWHCVFASPPRFHVVVFPPCPPPRCKSCSASFCTSFRGNFSVSSYRFSVSVQGSEFRILLRQHPEQENPVALSLKTWNNSSMRSRSPGMSSEGLESPSSSSTRPHHLALALCITGIEPTQLKGRGIWDLQVRRDTEAGWLTLPDAPPEFFWRRTSRNKGALLPRTLKTLQRQGRLEEWFWVLGLPFLEFTHHFATPTGEAEEHRGHSFLHWAFVRWCSCLRRW